MRHGAPIQQFSLRMSGSAEVFLLWEPRSFGKSLRSCIDREAHFFLGRLWQNAPIKGCLLKVFGICLIRYFSFQTKTTPVSTLLHPLVSRFCMMVHHLEGPKLYLRFLVCCHWACRGAASVLFWEAGDKEVE